MIAFSAHASTTFRRLLLPVLLFFFGGLLSACSLLKNAPALVEHVKESSIPHRVAVAPVQFSLKDTKPEECGPSSSDENKVFVSDLLRGVILNNLAGKGYQPLQLKTVDNRLKDLGSGEKGWSALSPRDLCDKLSVDGTVFINVVSFNMLTTVAYNYYEVEAEVKIVTKNGGQLGPWKESASERKVSVPTSIPGVIATVAESVLTLSPQKHMRMVVYDWGWKVSQRIPDCTRERTLPELISVDSNVDKGTFSVGEQIVVKVKGEKDLTCTFDLGDFKKDIPMAQSVTGEYQGTYTVQQGDKTNNQPLAVHLVKPNGVERIWAEAGSNVAVDGIPPAPPESVRIETTRNGVVLSWAPPGGENLRGFVIERSLSAAGEFTRLAESKDVRYSDNQAAQGSTYYYRVHSVDKAGNLSAQTEMLKATVPVLQEVALPRDLKGVLAPGHYQIRGEAVVPTGEILQIEPDTKLQFAPGSALIVRGTLKMEATEDRPIHLDGQKWRGVEVSPDGKATLTCVHIKGGSPGIRARGGNIEMRSVALDGAGGDGIVLAEDARFHLDSVEVSGFDRGVVIQDGRGKIEKSTFTKNALGIEYLKGSAELENSNVHGNQKDLLSHGKWVLSDNYLGTDSVRNLNVSGEVLMRSILDAPYPHGRRIVLMEKKEIGVEERQQQFATAKARGISALKEKKFGAAYQELNKALSLQNDLDCYIYLAHVLKELGEWGKLETTLESAISNFPYEVRFYQLYAGYLSDSDKRDKALACLTKGLKMQPDDMFLNFMSLYLASTTGCEAKKHSLGLKSDSNNIIFKAGDTVNLGIQAKTEARVAVFNITADEKIMMMFPNTYDDDNVLKKDKRLIFPPKNSEVELILQNMPGHKRDFEAFFIVAIPGTAEKSFTELFKSLSTMSFPTFFQKYKEIAARCQDIVLTYEVRRDEVP